MNKYDLQTMLEGGVEKWNRWKRQNSALRINLTGITFSDMDFSNINLQYTLMNRAEFINCNFTEADFRSSSLQYATFKGCNLDFAKFENAVIRGANLSGSTLCNADLKFSLLSRAQLIGTNFSNADMRGASLRRANLENAILKNCILRHASLVECDIENSDFSNSEIYGISAWSVKGEPKNQSNLKIQPYPETQEIIVDNLEVAQFVYLLRENRKIRDILNSITTKAVLILGRFSPERKIILEAIRQELRNSKYIPIIFDFEKANDLDFTETILTLTGMCRFVIADITNPMSAPLELHATIPNYMIPFIPIIKHGEKPFSMFVDLKNKYSWVLDPLEYKTEEDLRKAFNKAILIPANELHEELSIKKAQEIRVRSTKDFI